MTQLTLYHASPSRSSVTLWMLEEVGEPYDLCVLDLQKGEQKSPDYLAINPMGKVPALKAGDTIITEVAAICAWLADEYPRAELAPPIGDPRRGAYLKWLFFGPSVVEPAIWAKAFPPAEPPPPGAAGWRPLDEVMDIVANALTPGPYLLGDQFTAADVVIGSGLGWGLMFKLIPERAAFEPYLARIQARPAAMRAREKDAAMRQA